MRFDKASTLARGLIIGSAVLCVLGLIIDKELSGIKMLVTLGALLLLVSAFIIVMVFCKCPYCGKRIFRGASSVVYCPNCRRNLETGKKGSRKKVRSTFRK